MNVVIRKIANYLILDKVIVQKGDHLYIKTLTTFRNYDMEFDVGKEFEEDLVGVDDRKCMVSDNLIFKVALKVQLNKKNVRSEMLYLGN